MAWYNRIFKRSLNTYNPTTTSNDGVGLTNLLGISDMSSTSISSVFAAIELISNSLAQLPINVKTKLNNKTTIVENHSFYSLFDNCLISKYMMIKMLVTDMLLFGDGIAYIKRASDGTPINLIYCPHGTFTISYNENNRDLYYLIPSVFKGKIEPIDVIHLVKNSNNGVEGRGIINYAKNAINLSKYTEKSALDYFSSGCHVAGILSTDAPRLTEDQRNSIKNAWRQSHGYDGSGMAVLEAGMKYQPISSNSKDAQLIESRLFNIQDIARFFNINPVLLGDLSHSSYSTIEASLLEYLTHTLAPYIVMIQDELTRKLIKPSEKGLYIDLDETFILKSDKTSESNYLSTLVSNGIITINEARRQLGYNPVDGCDDLIIPYTDINQNKVNKNNNIVNDGEGN